MSDREPDHPHLWPLARPASASAALLHDPIAQSFALIVVVSLFFLLFPNFDLWFSGLFYQPGYGFPIGRLPVSKGLRDIANLLTALIAIGLIVSLILKLAFPSRPSLAAPRDVLFILGTLSIGPGLIVNLIFKNNWGRPRPVMLEVFSSSDPFVGVWHMSNYCTTNCSFVSGEASAAIWLITVVVLLPLLWRRTALRYIAVFAVLVSLNRIAAGGHFLSDVLLAWGMTLAVIALAYRFLYQTPPAALTNERLEAGMTRAGQAIRDFVHKLTARPAA